jgi:hypothetical protein
MLETPCEECGLLPVLHLTDYARTFGHVSSMDEFKGYAETGMCGWCQVLMAEFAVMNKTTDWKP